MQLTKMFPLIVPAIPFFFQFSGTDEVMLPTMAFLSLILIIFTFLLALTWRISRFEETRSILLIPKKEKKKVLETLLYIMCMKQTHCSTNVILYLVFQCNSVFEKKSALNCWKKAMSIQRTFSASFPFKDT